MLNPNKYQCNWNDQLEEGESALRSSQNQPRSGRGHQTDRHCLVGVAEETRRVA
jgi:hypothetical protein